MITFAVTFFQITPNFACEIPAFANFSIEEIQLLRFELFKILFYFLKLFFSSPQGDGDKFDGCKLYDFNYTAMVGQTSFNESSLAVQKMLTNETAIRDCKKWVFDAETDMKTTVITQVSEKKPFQIVNAHLVGCLLVCLVVSSNISSSSMKVPTATPQFYSRLKHVF